MKDQKKPENQKFRKTWMREASEQPGMILDVLNVVGLRLKTKRPPLESKKAS